MLKVDQSTCFLIGLAIKFTKCSPISLLVEFTMIFFSFFLFSFFVILAIIWLQKVGTFIREYTVGLTRHVNATRSYLHFRQN